MNTDQDNRIRLIRDVEANMVPSGDKVTLVAGNLVQITQSLGGNYTIVINGNMAQISAENADALGFEIEKSDIDKSTNQFSEQLVWDQLKTCYDPEIPVNVVDLGLIYSCKITESKDGGSNVDVKMTLTAPGCGMGDMIASEVKQKIEGVPGSNEVTVELVWDPPWDREMINEAARLQLGML